MLKVNCELDKDDNYKSESYMHMACKRIITDYLEKGFSYLHFTSM